MFYIHGALDRADALRKDEEALMRLRALPATRLLPVWSGNVLIEQNDADSQPRMATLPFDAEVPAGDPIFLGLVGETPFFAINANGINEQECDRIASIAQDEQGNPTKAEFIDLRNAGPLVPTNEGAMLAYARGLVYWQEHTRFCALCGHSLLSCHGGHVHRCSNSDCARDTFPRTDPAVIMLVTHQPEDGSPPLCLLGRSPAWPEGVFSTLAGFVEPGESLEQAVQREVIEEAAIQTDGVRYIASQPWPFPRSIMLGFEARALSTTIRCDPTELADARWFTVEELKSFGNWGDDNFELQLPRPDSIARFLINGWMERNG